MIFLLHLDLSLAVVYHNSFSYASPPLDEIMKTHTSLPPKKYQFMVCLATHLKLAYNLTHEDEIDI